MADTVKVLVAAPGVTLKIGKSLRYLATETYAPRSEETGKVDKVYGVVELPSDIYLEHFSHFKLHPKSPKPTKPKQADSKSTE